VARQGEPHVFGLDEGLVEPAWFGLAATLSINQAGQCAGVANNPERPRPVGEIKKDGPAPTHSLVKSLIDMDHRDVAQFRR